MRSLGLVAGNGSAPVGVDDMGVYKIRPASLT